MSRYKQTSAPENAVAKIGQHRWESCQEHARKVYSDNRVGVIWRTEERRTISEGGLTTSRAIVVRLSYVCDKCSKSFATPDDPEIYREDDEHENKKTVAVEGPREGGPIYTHDGTKIATTRIILGKIENREAAMLYEVIPKAEPGYRVPMTVYVRRLSIAKKYEKPGTDRVFENVSNGYVLCDRVAPYKPVTGMSREEL